MILTKIKELDFWLLGATFILIVFGLVILYAATSTEEAGLSLLFKRQVLWALIGSVLLAFTAALSPRVHYAFAYLLYFVSCLILLGVLLWGDPSKGAARWIGFGSVTFQPSEPAKIALVLALSRLVTDKKYDPGKFSHLLRTIALTAIPLSLVMAQPDLGTSLVFAAVFFFIAIAAGTPLTYLLMLISPIAAAIASISIVSMVVFIGFFILAAWQLKMRFGLLILLVAVNLSISLVTPQLWNQLKPYQKSRLVSFIHPEADPRGSGYQVIQSKVAVGSGGLSGKGLGKGSQTQLKFLPEQHTDFIFSVVGEELGFVGSSGVLLLLFIVIIRGYRAAHKSKGRYSALVCIGLSSMITFHIFINVGMTVGAMPVTGLPLPLISYGGSFLWTVMISIGLILGVQYRWKEYTP
jgi:rod shape determining protein RodA